MLDNNSKNKLVMSFNNVVSAVHNLRADIASEGRKAFVSSDTHGINELSTLLSKVNDIVDKIDKVAPVFKTYAIDIATDTHPAEFPMEGSNVIYLNTSIFPISASVKFGGMTLDIDIINENRFILKAPAIVDKKEGKLSTKLNKKLARLSSSGNITLINKDDKEQTIVINKDTVFKSANSLVSFISLSNITDGEKYILLKDGSTYSELLNTTQGINED